MITKFDKYKLITENPDCIFINNNEVYRVEDKDAIPFFSVVDNDDTEVERIFFGPNGGVHASINYYDYDRAYPGRLWIDHKMMSFWVYPNKELFKSIIYSIEKKLKLKIFNNGWKLEVIKDINGEFTEREKSDDIYFSKGGYQNAIIITLDEYVGSENFSEEEQILHLMKWNEKELAKKLGKIHFGGKFGSNMTAWDQPHNIKWRQAMYQEKKKNI